MYISTGATLPSTVSFGRTESYLETTPAVPRETQGRVGGEKENISKN